MSVPEIIYYKLGQNGTIYCTESENRINISMPTFPKGLIVLQFIADQALGDFLSVTTIYPSRDPNSEDFIGRYSGAFRY